MKKLIFSILSIFIISLLLTATVFAASTISNEDLDAYIAAEYEKTHIPDMSVEIVDGSNVLFTGNYGENASSDASFILGSISKSFTAVAILQLAQQGKLDINAKVADYIPDIVKPSSLTTLKQLLNQTSGIKTNMTLEHFRMSDTPAPFEYANVNYNLLGLIVERVSGMSYGEYIKANIFEPLGMNNSYASLQEAKQGNMIAGHRNYFGFMKAEDFIYPETTTSGWMTVPAAYLISTANDMGKYLQFWLAGNDRVLTDESRKAAFTDVIKVQDGYYYGYGWGISRNNHINMNVHGGNVENYTTYMVLLPDIGKAVIVLTNGCDFFASNDMVVALAENIGCKLAGVETKDLEAGTYVKTHVILNIIMLLVIISALIPLIFFKRWYVLATPRTSIFVKLAGVHVILPTLFLLVPTFLGSTLWIGLRFAPDLSIILIIGATILYLTGLLKIFCLIRIRAMS